MGVNYIYEDHLINRQYEAEQAMLKEFEEGNYTIQNPLVKYNLYIISPLSAVVCFETEEEKWRLRFTVFEKPKRQISAILSRKQKSTCFQLWVCIRNTPTK